MITPPPLNTVAASLLAGSQQTKALQPQKPAAQLTRRPTIPSNNSDKGRALNQRDDRLEREASNFVQKFDVSI